MYKKYLGILPSPPLACHTRFKERGWFHPPVTWIPESLWIKHTCPWSCHHIKVTEWYWKQWDKLSTFLPISRISLHFDRMPCYRKCSFLPRFRELSDRIPCTYLVVSTTCCTHSDRPSYDSWWSCVFLHLPEWDIVVGIGCHRYSGWPPCI